MIILEAVEPSPLAVKQAVEDQLWHQDQYVTLSILGYALILSEENQDCLHLGEQHENRQETAQDHPPAPIQKNSAHKVLFGAHRLRNQRLDSSVDTYERLVAKEIYEHVSQADTANNFNVF